MIDFAVQVEREGGLSPVEAIYKACLLRFRPILDDHHGRASRAMPLALGAVSAPSCAALGYHHRRRPHSQPDAHALHHACRYIYMDRLQSGSGGVRSHAAAPVPAAQTD